MRATHARPRGHGVSFCASAKVLVGRRRRIAAASRRISKPTPSNAVRVGYPGLKYILASRMIQTPALVLAMVSNPKVDWYALELSKALGTQAGHDAREPRPPDLPAADTGLQSGDSTGARMSALILILAGVILLEVVAVARAVIRRLIVDEILSHWQQQIEVKVEAILASLPEEMRAEQANDWRSARDALSRRPVSMALWARRFRHKVSERNVDSAPLSALAVKIESNAMFMVVAVIVAFVVAVFVPTVAVITVVVNAVGVDNVVSLGSALSSAVGSAVGSAFSSAFSSAVGSTAGSTVGSIVGGATVVYAVVCVYCLAQLLVLSVEQLLGLAAGYVTGLLRFRRERARSA